VRRWRSGTAPSPGLGPEAGLPAEHRNLPTLDARGRAVLPGFVDAHTHAVFTGDRSDEFARRLRGETYEEILAAGGGIHSTVAAVRAASQEDNSSPNRPPDSAGCWRWGPPPSRSRAGTASTPRPRPGCCRPPVLAGEAAGVDVVPDLPRGPRRRPGRSERDAYLDLVIGEMLPACAPLARFCDVFADEAPSPSTRPGACSRPAWPSACGVRIHAEQLARTGAAAIGVAGRRQAPTTSTTPPTDDARPDAAAGTVAVLLPSVALSMRTPIPRPASVGRRGDGGPGHRLQSRDRLCRVDAAGDRPSRSQHGPHGRRGDLGSDAGGRTCPRTGRSGSPRARSAIGDLLVLDAPTHLHIAYRPAADIVAAVVKRGEIL
jgi:imidazolonepropionase